MGDWEDDGEEDFLVVAVRRMDDNEMNHEKIFPMNASESGAQVERVVAELGPTVGDIEIEMNVEKKKVMIHVEACEDMEDNVMINEKISPVNGSESEAQAGGVVAELSPTVGEIKNESEKKEEKSKDVSVLNGK